MPSPVSLRQAFARFVPRVLLAVALLFGAGLLLTGNAQRSDVANAYRIEFGHEGAECDEYLTVHLSADTGEALACTPSGISFGATQGFPGFTPAQDGEVGALVRRLAPGGLTEAEQQQIQTTVDRLAAGVPEANRPYHYSGLWGTGEMGVGGALVVAAPVLFFTLRRRLESWVAGSPARR
ncbi:hypothetical protein VSH64_21630 [Amycolatopsis rhabdoformis]|uniref:DUF3592 domain-containing protein n=1 Tax=Amycolatopsis rhabdoformis TaxID=1448059 RepID=A0ABZ1IJK8_9PSEU|nr:hypothetical protein [Amycolatopsis rhabdoformis]WSE34649.1 hypothetical protein VSH64_21630 [Amycolatopsis rhabdoformis]